ncbi:MAG: hypothetical protein N3C12_01445 [Candidatus Binatia bacterium]|nr:hypothetical protein [Candidatus Binatia bacterium]
MLCGAWRSSFAGDLPPASPNIETIPAGSLVIPMDNDKQNMGAPFNLKAYGLVQRLLKAQIPVKWVIRTGKAKDGVDFSGQAERVLPSAQAAGLTEFRGGPFVVETGFAAAALDVAMGYGNNVAVYRLTQAVEADVRYTLRQRAFVFVANDDNNASVHTAILLAAGFVAGEDYAVLARPTTSAQLNANLCATIVTEPHYDGSGDPNWATVVAAVRDFLASGGNVLAQCKAIESYENHPTYGRFQTTNGVVKPGNSKTGFNYLVPDLAFSQFVGDLHDQGGATPRYALAQGSSFQNGGHAHIEYRGAGAGRFKASVSKLGSEAGSLVFYLAGHDYSGSSIESINGRRMYLNAVFHPARRPASCGFDFPSPTPTSPTATPASPTPTFAETLTPIPVASQVTPLTATPSVSATATSVPATPTFTAPPPSFTGTATPTATSVPPTRTFTFTPTSTPNPCGNGDLDPGEECDDGNNDNGDCCNATCQLDPAGTLCEDGLDCTEGDYCDGVGVCRSEPSTGQYAILRWVPSDEIGSFVTLLSRRALVGGHVCTGAAHLAGSSRILGDLVGLLTSGNALSFGKRTHVLGAVVTRGGAVVGAQNAAIGEFLGADSSDSTEEVRACAEARTKTFEARELLVTLPNNSGAMFGATKVKARKTLRIPASGQLGGGTVVADFDDLKIGSTGAVELVGSASTEDVVIRVQNQLRMGRRAKFVLDGLEPNQVVLVVNGRTTIGDSAYLPGTLIGGDRIIVRRRARVEGGLFGKTVLVSGSAKIRRAGWVGWCR